MSDDAEPAQPGAEGEVAPARPTQMEPKEQRYGLILAGLCIAAIAIPWFPKMISGEKGAIWKFVLSLGMALILALAARRGQRVVGTFAAALSGIVVLPRFLPGLVTQFLCLVYAGWLMLKTNRAMRASNKALRRMSPSQRAAAREEAREAKAARRRGAAPDESVRRPAAASKRYTPPKKKKQTPDGGA